MSRQKKFYLEPRKPSGIYYFIIRDPVSRKTVAYKSTGTADKKQAELIGMEWWTNGIPGKSGGSGFDRKSLFCDYLYQFWDFETSDYFRELETMGKEPHVEHAQEMQKAVNRYFRPYFGNKLLCQIDEEYLQKFIVYLKIDKKLSASTVNSARNAAFVALRHAKRKKVIQHFDFDAVLRAGGKAKERGILEKEEVDRLFSLEWPSPRSRMAVLIAANTGMRMGEVRALRVCDIHENRISVIHSWGRKSELKCTKNQETREIPILPALHDEIMAYIRQIGTFSLDGFLLPGDKPEIPYNNRQIGKDFNKMLDKIGIDEKTRKERGIVFHSWRHLLAKNLAEKGTNKAIGMKILGHKTSRIFDHYASHVDKETFRQMTGALENVLKPETPSREPIPFRGVV
jgi:integrase